MNYIVFDLEWNQNPSGKKTRNDRLPFEIIEIGAVKVNSKKEITDHFHRLIKPQVYKWIHDSIHEVIHVDYKDHSVKDRVSSYIIAHFRGISHRKNRGIFLKYK